MQAITIGDPCGVGPEILLRTWAEGLLENDAVAVGDVSVLQKTAKILNLKVPLLPVHTGGRMPARDTPGLRVLDTKLLKEDDWEPGILSPKAGAAAYEYIDRATRSVVDGQFDALVTLPVNKESIRATHPYFSGHTGLIADICNGPDVTMMLASEKLIVTHVSTHVSLADAIMLVSPDRVRTVIRLTRDALVRLRSEGRQEPRIAVAGLNPHAGEGRAFGDEDAEVITPAVRTAREAGIDATGPHPPDTVFKAAVDGRYDAVVCMYHDQGHIPMKLLDFDGAVNITLGLPIIRTSVDHGTAYDIAGKGIASVTSFVNACEYARRLSLRS